MSERLKLGISPCPNDTFAFAGLLEGAVECDGAALEFELCDVQALNERLARGEFDAAKASFHAALRLGDTTAVLSAGSALGFGVGPLLLSRADAPALDSKSRVLCPGEWTTATLLFQLFHGALRVEQRIFSEIMPALERGEADFGVCIHEGRFTWKERGLVCVEDLGARWEADFGCALPLGGILFRRTRGPQLATRLCAAIEASIAWSRAHPERALSVMRAHAQELSDEVLWQHVNLYVNTETVCLSSAARTALATLAAQAAQAAALGLVPATSATLTIWGREPLRLFHLLHAKAARALLLRDGTWNPPSLASQGFVHLSFAEQLAGTLEAHFHANDELVLLELEPARLGLALRYEPSRGGALFPHLYRELRREDVLRHWPLTSSIDRWGLPPDCGPA